jgi:DNA-binding NarL/FixJ family response regulator
MIRVVLAEDSYLVREGVRLLLETVDEVDLVATCESLPELLETVAELEPDVVLTDIRMPPTGTNEGIRAAEQLRSTHPGIGVVVLSQYVDPSFAVGLFAAGSGGRAYLLKERVGDVDELLRAIRAVAQGGSVMDPAVVDALVSARRVRPSVLDRLTARETEVLAQIATGRNNAAIAKALVLSERAVEKHINSIFAKLELTAEPDVHRRVRAVLLYLAAADGSASITGG